jgi:hypothetical protein
MPSSALHKVDSMISRFDPITLGEMAPVLLMDRVDMKFILPFSSLEQIMAELNGNYRILTVCENKVFSYRTKYFDTPEFIMYYDHHNGKLNRYKIRHREYVESCLGFLEVKFRSNKGRVVKQRIKNINADQQLFNEFIAEHTPYNPVRLSCTSINRFNRFTLVDNRMKERVTADFNLVFSDNVRDISLNGLVIIEIKQDQADKTSAVYQALKKHSFKPSTISKYCVGLSLLNEKPKANYFKQIILQINKLSHVDFSA